MKRNIKTRLWAFIACIMLVLSLTTLSAAAEEAEVGAPEDSTVEEESTVETEASENIFADLFGVLEHVFENDNPMPYGASMILTDTGLLENLTQSTIRLYTVLVALPAVTLLVTGIVVLRRRRYR